MTMRDARDNPQRSIFPAAALAGLAAVVCLVAATLPACWRSDPPALAEFVPPPVPAPQSAPVVELDDDAGPVTEAPKPAVKKEEPKPEAVAEADGEQGAPAQTRTAESVKQAEPTIIGSWRVTSMSHNGQTMPMPDGMDMRLTFNEDGTCSISQSFQGRSEDMQGTYTLDGTQITISLRNESKSGTFTLNSADSATLEIEGGQLELTRV